VTTAHQTPSQSVGNSPLDAALSAAPPTTIAVKVRIKAIRSESPEPKRRSD
jgi:hypothetical protein